MVLSNRELEQLADDTYRNRLLTVSVYCGRCGYNLRTLPYVYTCPECGGEYNARPLIMRGIFIPQDVEFPFADIVAMLFCGGCAALLIYRAFQASLTNIEGLLALIPLTIAVVFAVRSVRAMKKYFNAQSIIRRITTEEG